MDRLHGTFFTCLLLCIPPSLHAQEIDSSCSLHGEPIPLAQLWSESRLLERGYDAADQGIVAVDAERSAVRREWIPSLAVDALGNHGQRLSPGEERVLGVGPRGEMRLVAAWTLLDSTRGWRLRAVESLRSEAEVERAAFDLGYRVDLARLYVEAALAEVLWELRNDQLNALEALAVPVRRRMDLDVDVTWEGHLLEEALARTGRRLEETAQARAGARAELSFIVGRCVRPAAIYPILPPSDGKGPIDRGVFPDRSPLDSTDRETDPPDGVTFDNPEVNRLLGMAQTRDALAGVESGRNRWQLQLIGTTGPTRSRAFADGPIENEYLIGFNASWTPDLSGMRGQLASAERARARALRAEADGQRALVSREMERIAIQLEHAEGRHAGLEREVVQASRRLEIAVARWEAGVDRWTEVIQAQERVQEAHLLQIELLREVALAQLRYAEITGKLDALPRYFGQDNDP